MSGQEDKKEKKKSGTPLSVRFAFFVSMVAAVVFLPTTIVLAVCMIPTMVAMMVDSQTEKTAGMTVGAMNFVGTVPVWFSLWDAGHTIPAALQIALQPMTIMLSYGAAAVGWLLYNNIPSFVASLIVSKNERRLRDIDRRQRELLKKWGKDVTMG